MPELPRPSNGEPSTFDQVRAAYPPFDDLVTLAAAAAAELESPSPLSPARYSWTQPVCDTCWDAKNPVTPSPGQGDGEPETCAYCGLETRSGIYVRDDPGNVPFPALVDG